MPREVSGITIRNDSLEDHYLIGEKLGDGHFAEVKLATCKNSQRQYAAKFILRKRQNLFGYVDPNALGMTLSDIEREAKILAQLDHENIIKLHEVFHHKDSVVLIIELVTGGELFARVAECERLSEEEASNFINQVLYGVEHIHSSGIVHLDLKPENIMIEDLDSRKIKLIDFGLARTLHPNQSFQDMAGTPEFCAPEIVNFDPITYATDMWAVGVITYILLTGISPFAGDSQLETFQNILDCYVDYDRPEMEGVSELAKDFIRHLLAKNPAKRSTAKECMQHPWIRPVEQSQLRCRRSSTIIRNKLSHLRQFVVSTPPSSPTHENASPCSQTSNTSVFFPPSNDLLAVVTPLVEEIPTAKWDPPDSTTTEEMPSVPGPEPIEVPVIQPEAMMVEALATSPSVSATPWRFSFRQGVMEKLGMALGLTSGNTTPPPAPSPTTPPVIKPPQPDYYNLPMSALTLLSATESPESMPDEVFMPAHQAIINHNNNNNNSSKVSSSTSSSTSRSSSLVEEQLPQSRKISLTNGGASSKRGSISNNNSFLQIQKKLEGSSSSASTSGGTRTKVAVMTTTSSRIASTQAKNGIPVKTSTSTSTTGSQVKRFWKFS